MARTDNKGSAELRKWEINDNSTRYDHLLAAPSDEELTRYWTAWAVISTLGGLFVAVFLIGIVLSRNVRKRAFNLYLIYLMIPDAVYSILCGIVCLCHAVNKSQVASLCNFQQMFVVWGVGSNMWLNAAVSYQLHSMLRGSNNLRKFSVPDCAFVTKQALSIYAFTLFLGTWGLIESPKFPHYVASTSGLACLPVEHDLKSSIFFWVVFFPLFGGIPMIYIQYVCYDIWRKKLMPPTGKRRLLAVYFGRIVLVFVLMWVPYMILVFMFATWMPTWVHFYGGTLSHLQGAVSASLCLFKPDIYFAVKRFVCCQWCKEIGDGGRDTVESSSWMAGHSVSRAFRSRPFRVSRPGSSNKSSSAQINASAVEAQSQQMSDQEIEEMENRIWPDENGRYFVETENSRDSNIDAECAEASSQPRREDDDAEVNSSK